VRIYLLYDIGNNGGISDGRVVENTKFYEELSSWWTFAIATTKETSKQHNGSSTCFLWEMKFLLCTKTPLSLLAKGI
jgi:hypothetical protein